MFQFLTYGSYHQDHTENGVILGKLLKNPNHAKQNAVGAICMYAPSVTSFLDYIKKNMPEAKRGKSSDSRGRDSFNSLESFDVAMDTYRNHPEKVVTFHPSDVHIKSPDGIGNQINYDVAGDFIDMGRFLEGDPDHFGNMHMENPKNHYANILVNASCVWYVGEDIRRRVAMRIMRLVDWLETEHIRTSIRLFNSTECAHIEVVVKDFSEPFNINSLAAATHPDFHRRMIFRVDEYSDTWESGYGTAACLALDTMKIPQWNERGIFIISDSITSMEHVDPLWDAAEEALVKKLEEGERTFPIIVKGNRRY